MIKIWTNLGLNAIKTLGLRTYLNMLTLLITNIHKVLISKSLGPVDRRMPKRKYEINHKFGRFFVDVEMIDSLVVENSFAFGSIRELYVRNCYFKYQNNINLHEISTVIDLGANRGMVSLLCSNFAKKIILVECQPQYNKAICFNLESNNFKNYKIINKYIGNGGTFDSIKHTHISLNEIIEDNNIESIDFLKIDIEGAEFSLFENNFPYNKVKFISMEIHQNSGSPSNIINKLKSNGFNVTTATSSLTITDNINEIEYLYAQKI